MAGQRQAAINVFKPRALARKTIKALQACQIEGAKGRHFMAVKRRQPPLHFSEWSESAKPKCPSPHPRERP